jgi:hypothetical protein
MIAPGETISLTLQAHDPDCPSDCTTGCGQYIRSDLTSWTADGGSYSNVQNGTSKSPYTASADWTAPLAEGAYTLTVQIADSGGMMCGGREYASQDLVISVTTAEPPVITALTATPGVVDSGGTALIDCVATDPKGSPLTYDWSTTAGSVTSSSPSDPTATYTAPALGNQQAVITCTVTNAGWASDSATVTVDSVYWEAVASLGSVAVSPARIAVAESGEFAVSDPVTRSVKWFSPTGDLEGYLGNVEKPLGVAALPGGGWAVGDAGSGKVSVYDAGGTWLFDLGAGDGEFATPADIAVGVGGDFYVVDKARDIVRVYAAGGTYLRSIGQSGRGDGELAFPVAAALSPDASQLYVSDFGNDRVVVFQSDGTWVANWRGSDIDVDAFGGMWMDGDGNLFVTDVYQGRVQMLDSSGVLQATISEYGTEDGKLQLPLDCEGDAYHRLFVACANKGSVEVFQLGGQAVAPGPASGVTAQDNPGDNGGQIIVQWALSPDDGAGRGTVLGYDVLRKDPVETEFVSRGTVGAGATQYADSTTDGLLYTYKIRAFSIAHAADSNEAQGTSVNDLPPATPLGVSALADDAGNVTVSWAANADPDLAGYILAYGTTSGSYGAEVATGLVTSYTLSGLPEDITHYFAVQAEDTAANRSPYSTEVSAVPHRTPSAPAGVKGADTCLGGELLVWWMPNPPAETVDRYVVNVVNSGTGQVTAKMALQTILRVGGLEDGVLHTVSVAAINDIGTMGPFSAGFPLVPSQTAEALPALGEYGNIPADPYPHSDSMGYTFLKSSDDVVLAYEITEVSLDEVELFINDVSLGFVAEHASATWSATRTVSIPLGALKEGVNSVLFNNDLNPLGNEPWGVRGVYVVPHAPSQVRALADNSIVFLSWDYVRDDALLGYRVYRWDSVLGQFVRLFDVPIDKTTYVDTGLTNGESYLYEVRAVIAGDIESAGVQVAATPTWQDPMAGVYDIYVTKQGDDLLVEWTEITASKNAGSPPKAVTSYLLEWDTTPLFPSSWSVLVSGNSAIITGGALSPPDDLYIRVTGQ